SYRTANGPLNERRLLHHAKVGRFLDELRCHHGGLGADITIQLNNGSILRIHSPVAAAHSAFFRQLIVDKGPALHVDLSSTPRSDAVRRAVDYMYSGTIDADLNDFVDLLLVAHTWEISSLRELLETRLLEHSRQPSTLLKALDVAALNTTISDGIRSAVLGNALKNFRQIVQSRSGFAKLSPNAVVALLSSDELPVNSELDVARIVLSYLHIAGNRGLDEQLLCVIRIEHLDAAGLAELEHLVRSQDPTLTALLHRIVQSIKTDMFRSQRPRRRFTASGAVPSPGRSMQRGNSKSRISAQQQPSQSRIGAVGVAPFTTTISQPQLRTTSSVAELRKVPDPFARKSSDDVFAPRPQLNQVASFPQQRDVFEYSPYLEDRTQEVVNRNLRSKSSIYELRNVPNVFEQSDRFNKYPDPFGTNRLAPQNSYPSVQPFGFQTSLGSRQDYSPYVEQGSQTAINRNLRTKDSVFEIRNVPDL
ncbi:Protein F27C8.5, partial [Aphelenchoides avenae]